MMTALFFLMVDIFEMMFHMNLLAYGSTPVEGSSKKTKGGLPIKAIATDNFLLFPPESTLALILVYSTKSISLMDLSINRALIEDLTPLSAA